MIEINDWNGAYLPDDPGLIAVGCPFCHAHMELLGDYGSQIADGQLTLDEWDMCECPSCGATFGEGTALEVIREDDSACAGFGCVDGCGDCEAAA